MHTTRRVLTVPALPESANIFYFTFQGKDPGPHLAIIAGVHGCEYTSQAAARKFARYLEANPLKSGSIMIAPTVNRLAYDARSPFVVPLDGKNLNRTFPGNPNGSATEVLADAIFQNLIKPADFLIDLHAGDLPEGLEPFAMFDESPVEAQSKALAMAFGSGNVIRQASDARTIGGSSSSSAADIGIPAIIGEAGGNGILDDVGVNMHYQGLVRICAHLGLLDKEMSVPASREYAGWVWVRSTGGGWWQQNFTVGDKVQMGDTLGTITDPYGDLLEEIIAPVDGYPLFVTSSPAVAEDGLLLGLAYSEKPEP